MDIKVVDRIVVRLGILAVQVAHIGLLEKLVALELVAAHTEPRIQAAAVAGHKSVSMGRLVK